MNTANHSEFDRLTDALPPATSAATPNALANLVVQAIQQTDVWKWMEAQMHKANANNRVQEDDYAEHGELPEDSGEDNTDFPEDTDTDPGFIAGTEQPDEYDPELDYLDLK